VEEKGDNWHFLNKKKTLADTIVGKEIKGGRKTTPKDQGGKGRR